MEKFLRWVQKIGIGLGLILLVSQGYKGYLALSAHSIVFINPTGIFISITIIFFTIGFQVFAWNVLMKASGFKIPFIKATQGYIVNFLPRYIPGSFWGYISRSQWLSDQYQINYQSSNSISIIEIVIAVTASSITILSFLFTKIDIALIFIIPLLYFGSFFIWLIADRLLNIPIVKKVLSYWHYSDCVNNLTFGAWLKSLGIIILNMYLNGISFYFLLYAFGLSGNELTISFLMEITGLYNMSWLIGFLAFFLPAGIGLRELSFSTLLVNGLLIDANVASGLAIIFRLVNIAAEMVWVLFGSFIGRKSTHD